HYLHVLADGEPVVLAEASGQLRDMRVARLSLALRLGGSHSLGGPSLRGHALSRGFPLPVIILGASERLLGGLGAKSAHWGSGIGSASDPRSSGGTAAVIRRESKLMRGSRARDDRSRSSSSATRRSIASVLATASSSRATASAAMRSFSACRSRRSRSFWAAAHSRYVYGPPDEPEPRPIAHLLTASNGLLLESNSREHWRQCVSGESRG